MSTTPSKPKVPAFCSGKQRFNPIEIARYRARDNIQVSASNHRPSTKHLNSLSSQNVCFSRTIENLSLDLSYQSNRLLSFKSETVGCFRRVRRVRGNKAEESFGTSQMSSGSVTKPRKERKEKKIGGKS